LDLAVSNKKEEAAAVLRAHGALHSLHFKAEQEAEESRGGFMSALTMLLG
jgi:hypothetical protein